MSNNIRLQEGQRFGILTVVRQNGYHGKLVAWLCLCDCGVETNVAASFLKKGTVKSCGCNRYAWRVKADGYVAKPEYTCWAAMKTRCKNPNSDAWRNYGGRGIRICDRWYVGENGKHPFECFLEDMGPRPSRRHSVDRIDNNGNYEPTNCRWATSKEQCANIDRSRHIPMVNKLACALLALGHIDRDLAKNMTPEQIVSHYEFDHAVFFSIGGSHHPTNLTARPKAEHRLKTAKVDVPAIAKMRRLEPAHIEFQQRMLAKVGQAEPDEEHLTGVSKKSGPKLRSRGFQTGKKVKIKSAGFRGARKFNGDVNWKDKG